MWYGMIDAKTAAWAEREANNVEHEKRKERIAKWVAGSAIKKAQSNAELYRRLRMDEIGE